MSKLLKNLLLFTLVLLPCLTFACGSKKVEVGTQDQEAQAAEKLPPEQQQAVEDLRKTMGKELQEKTH